MLGSRWGACAALGAALACGDPTEPRPGVIGEWQTASPLAQGLDSTALAEFAQQIEDGDYGFIQSFVVVRNGYIVFEQYFRGGQQDAPVPVYSVTKSVASLLVGIAQEQGYVGSLQASILGFFPEYPVVGHPGADKRAITLEHVLQMRTGLEWDEWSEPYATLGNPTTQLAESTDWIKHVLDLPMAAPPGTVFGYNSGASMLLAGVLRNEAGRSAAEYAVDVLFEPLGIESAEWQTGPDEVANTGWGLALSARDMARIGYLVAAGGEWNERRIVPRAWLDASLQAHSEFANGEGYGYQWWIGRQVTVDETPIRPISARGWGDQLVFILPGTGLVLVVTGRNFEESGMSATTLADVAAWALVP